MPARAQASAQRAQPLGPGEGDVAFILGEHAPAMAEEQGGATPAAAPATARDGSVAPLLRSAGVAGLKTGYAAGALTEP